MTMSPQSRPRTFHPAVIVPWLLGLAIGMLARSFNMPEPLVHSAGIFVFAQAQAADPDGEIALSVPPAASAPRLAPQNPHPPRNQRRTAMIQPSLFLRRALLADAIFSGVSALALTFGAGAFAALLSLPEALLVETGLFLIAYAAFVGWLGTRHSTLKTLVAIVIAGNAAWTLTSIALLLSGAVSPNLLGEIAVVVQAIATGVFAELQYVGLRKSNSAVAA
jgi:hypothetical protein